MKYVDETKINTILNEAACEALSGYRNYCILVLITDYGLKIIDLINIKIKDIDWETGNISLRRKGGFYRTVMLNEKDLSMLYQLRCLCKDLGEDSWLFPNSCGRKFSTRSMVKMIKRMAQKTGVQVKSKDLIATYVARRIQEEGIYEVAKDLGYCKPEYLKRFLSLD